METTGMGSVRSFSDRPIAKEVRPPRPDFIIKYELVNEPPRPGGEEELICGTEADAIEAVQRLIETGRTTPGRVSIYGNLNPIVTTSVTFPPSAQRR